jgi:hypothetical protein
MADSERKSIVSEKKVGLFFTKNGREGEKNASYFSVLTQKCKMFKGHFRGGYCFFFKTIKYVLCLQHTGTTFKKQKTYIFNKAPLYLH